MSKRSNRRRRQHPPLVPIPNQLPVEPNAPAVTAGAFFAMRHESFSGPVPPPEILIQYNEAIPGAADRIISMAENQAKHRQTLEAKVIGSEVNKSYLGLGAGLIIAIVGIVSGALVISTGHDWAGATIAGIPLVTLVSVFVLGSNKREQERVEKSKSMRPK